MNLGASDAGRIVVTRLSPEGCAYKQASVEQGDEVLMVGDHVVHGLPVRHAQKMLDDSALPINVSSMIRKLSVKVAKFKYFSALNP